MTTEKNGWFTTAAEEAEQKAEWLRKHARMEAIPEYAKLQEDIRYLCGVLTEILFVESNEFSVPPPRYPPKKESESVVHRMAPVAPKPQKPPSFDSNGYYTQEYQDFMQQRGNFYTLINRYARWYRPSRWSDQSRDRAQADSSLGRYSMAKLRQGLKRGASSIDVGSSLYIYQQMHERQSAVVPTLSKAAWLVKNAPLREPVPDVLTPRGKWELIQEHWKHNVDDAHYWAAVIAMTPSPFMYNEDTLLEFLCTADIDQFRRLARTFFEFRKNVIVPKGSKTRRMYLKQLPLEIRDDLEDVQPLDPLTVPNLVGDFQWAVLTRYRSS